MSTRNEIATCGLVIRLREHAVLLSGRELELTSREFEIIRKLAEHPGWVLSAEQLAAEDDFYDYSPESVSVLVSRLRHKLSDAGAPDLVETVRGFGYRLHVADCAPDDSRPSAPISLRDAMWGLQLIVLDAASSATPEQQVKVVDALDQARSAIREALAERPVSGGDMGARRSRLPAAPP